MMSGGNDGVVKVAAAARRPAIRPKPVTPPRTASPLHHTGTWTLPPVRTPAPHPVAVKRPVLALVEQVEQQAEEAALAPAPLEVIAWWRQPRTVGLVAASVLACTFTTTAVVWTASARREAAEAAEAIEAVGTTTLASASLSLSAPPATTTTTTPTTPRATEPAIPEVDVNSLPPAPSRVASGATR